MTPQRLRMPQLPTTPRREHFRDHETTRGRNNALHAGEIENVREVDALVDL
jgi:hypothetical protein